MRDRVLELARHLVALVASCVALSCSSGHAAKSTAACPGTKDDPATAAADIPRSCAFTCIPCDEPAVPYACPAMAAWAKLPHAKACGCFNPDKPIVVTQGKCTASAPTGDALDKAGRAAAGGVSLPDGHIVSPAGHFALLDEPDLVGTFPDSLLLIPGTGLALSSDGGMTDNALRLLDLDALATGGAPSVAHVKFARPSALYYGVAWLPPSTALASGGDDGFIYAFTVDLAQKTLVRDPTRDIDLGDGPGGSIGDARWYSGPLAVTGDGTQLLVAPSTVAKDVQVRSVDAATWGQSLGSIPITATSVYAIQRDPFDPAGNTFYATLWNGNKVVEIDAASQQVIHTLGVGKNPEGIAFLDAKMMVVASTDDDSFSIIDRAAWVERSRVDLRDAAKLHGRGPSELAYDAARGRLYATLSGSNAVAVYDVTTSSDSATLAPIGSIPTAWWPTGVGVRDDGSIAILSGKGTSTGGSAITEQLGPMSGGPLRDKMRGGVQVVLSPSQADLDAMSAEVDENRTLSSLTGYPKVSCPAGANDFPVPASPEAGPSKVIKHVVFVVRENKTFDALFGDLSGVDGDPKLVMGPGQMDVIWKNTRKLARGFTLFDNYYTDTEESFQGHVWTTFGRTTDYVQRTIAALARPTRPATMGLSLEGQPEEGSIFSALDRAGVPYAALGEFVGKGKRGIDVKYPGIANAINKPDIEKACYVAGRARILCDLPALTYATLPNDHTNGGAANSADPGVMIAVNDEGTGMLVDAISHSPLWASTLIIVTEDDTQNGGDHVELHRAPLFMASPWVKRGYVSHGHYDVASVHRLILTILGVGPDNEMVENAPLPLDAFTSTPDYTPYEYSPRTYDRPCNPPGTGAARAADFWTFDTVDSQPALDQWAWRIVHDHRYEK